MYVDVECLMHILISKCYVYELGFLRGVGGQVCANVEYLIHVLEHKCYNFVGFLKANIDI